MTDFVGVQRAITEIGQPLVSILGANDTSVDETAGGVTCLAAGDRVTGVTLCKAVNTGTDSVTLTHGTVAAGNGEVLANGEDFFFHPDNPPMAICASEKSTTLHVVQYG